MVWLEEHLYWGLLNTKGQQGYTVLHPFIILRRIRLEPEATRSCPPVTWPSYTAIWGRPHFWVIYNVNSGAKETGLGNASFAAPGDLEGLFKVATPPAAERRPPILDDARFGYSRVQPPHAGERPGSKSGPAHWLANQAGPLRSHPQMLRVPRWLAGLYTLQGEMWHLIHF